MRKDQKDPNSLNYNQKEPMGKLDTERKKYLVQHIYFSIKHENCPNDLPELCHYNYAQPGY